MRLAFITPAWGRYALSRVCFAHRRWMLDRLHDAGHETLQVVVADDDNLELALRERFDTVEHENVLGERWNVGYRHAAEWAADYTIPVGSDTWLHPDVFTVLPPPSAVVAVQRYAVVHESGRRMAELNLARPKRPRPSRWPAVGAWAFPSALTAEGPCDPQVMSGCDGSTFRGIEAAHGPLEFTLRPAHPLDVVAFRSDVQITPYDRLRAVYHGPVTRNVWARLAEHHPQRLVEAARDLHQERVAA